MFRLYIQKIVTKNLECEDEILVFTKFTSTFKLYAQNNNSNLTFLIKTFFYMTKNSGPNVNILRAKRPFKVK